MKIEKGTIKRIHVNQHNIRHNAKNPEETLPVFTCKTSKANLKGYAVHIYGPSAVVYQPEDPLACGAKVWIQTTSEVEIFEEYTE
jgi:hypothetical protein